MSQAPSSGPGPLPLSGSRRVDSACDRFEAAWHAGAPPRLEDFLGAPAHPERAALLRELVVLDIFYRRQLGRECRVEDYTARFPDLDPVWLAAVISPEATALSAGPQTPPAELGKRVAADSSASNGDTVAPAGPTSGSWPPRRAGATGCWRKWAAAAWA
jgi:hypothetical protein